MCHEEVTISTLLQELFAQSMRHTCPKGQILVNAGEEPRGVIQIHRGYVKSYDISQHGEYQILSIERKGDIVPLYWALDASQRPLFYEAMGEVEFSIMPRDEFNAKLAHDERLLHEVINHLVGSYAVSQQRIRNLEYRTAAERLAYRLVFLGAYFGHEKGGATHIALPITYQDLADSVNLTRDTVNRTIRTFIDEGWLRRRSNHLVLLAPDKLRGIFSSTAVR